MVKGHGERAETVAAQQVDERLAEGDMLGRDIWRQAATSGLMIDPTEIPAITNANCTDVVHDPYRDLLGGACAVTHPSYYGSMHLGVVGGIEAIDQTALDRRVLGRPGVSPKEYDHGVPVPEMHRLPVGFFESERAWTRESVGSTRYRIGPSSVTAGKIIRRPGDWSKRIVSKPKRRQLSP